MTSRDGSDERIVRTESVARYFGGIHALEDVSLGIRPGIVTAVIGPNGAGKSTLFNCITGVLKPTTGDVFWEDRRITGWSPNRVARLGMARTFQLPRVFPSLSVIENVMLGASSRRENAILAIFSRWRRDREDQALAQRATEMLEVVGLGDFAHHPASDLGYAEKKLVEIARCLMMNSKVILLDEPFSGIYGETISNMMSVILKLARERHKAVCLIEHNMTVVMRISDYVYVLDYGRLLSEGTCSEVQCDERVVKAYLGGS